MFGLGSNLVSSCVVFELGNELGNEVSNELGKW